MTTTRPEDDDQYIQATTQDYDPELDDPEDDTTGYENDADAPGEGGQ
jgi:hypothetical protein